MHRRSILMALLVLGGSSCSSFGGDEPLDRVQAAQTTSGPTVPNTGFVPFPVFSNQFDANGKPRRAWTGSYADLLAADALAECAFGVADEAQINLFTGGGGVED